MSIRNIISSIYTKLTFALLLTIVSLASYSPQVNALPATNSDFSASNCQTLDYNTNSISVVLSSVPTFDEIYFRSQPNQIISPTSLLFQSFSTGDCTNLGTITPKINTWTRIDSKLTAQEVNGGGSFIAASQTIGTAPYESALQILLISDSSACTPTNACQTTYHGWSGVLQPTIISGATDQIEVYVAKSIQNVAISTVNYYDDQVFLYSKPSIQPVDYNYLNGGGNIITTVASLSNGEQFTVTKYINMGPDYSGYLFLRSSIFRSDGRAVFILKVAMAIALLGLILLLLRHQHNKKLYKLGHGLEGYKKSSEENNDNSSDQPRAA